LPQTEVYFYCEADGRSDVWNWLLALRNSDAKAFIQCLAKLRLLKMSGHELRRPAADYLRDGIYELRAKRGTVQYRLLYFFGGRNVAVVACGLTKKETVPTIEIARAIERKGRYEKDPQKHRWPKDVESIGSPS
jgi:hypothetical protein